MQLATLVTNTDESDFAHRNPRDDAKFAELVHRARPDWRVEGYWVKDGVFPDDIGRFDGLMITGSPASVNDGEDWMLRLEELIREAVARRIPLFAACFGHQAVARALGGRVGKNPGGWVFGLTEAQIRQTAPWMDGQGGAIRLYASHSEQVLEPPEGITVLTGRPDCPVSGFAIGDHVFTTQYHPEMSHDFMSGLVEELADELPAEVIAQARDSLKRGEAETDRFAGWVARFFEGAARRA